MLILTRKEGESIVLPTLGISVLLLDVRGDRAVIGVEAPRKVPVHRQEVWLQIQTKQSADDAPV